MHELNTIVPDKSNSHHMSIAFMCLKQQGEDANLFKISRKTCFPSMTT